MVVILNDVPVPVCISQSFSREDMATSTETLPLACEEILVSFQLSDEEHVWWCATVEEIHAVRGRGKILATATVLYERAHSYPAERVNVSFMRHNIIRPDGSSLICEGEESSWKFRNEDNLMQEKDDRHVQFHQMDTTKQPVRTRRAERMGNSAAAVEENQHVTRTALPEFAQELTKKVNENAETSERLWFSLTARLQVLERGLSQMRMCDHRILIDERVKAVRVSMKLKIIEEIQRPLQRSLSRSASSNISGTLARCSLNVAHSCDWDLFKIVARDIAYSSAAQNVVFLPSYTTTQHCSHDVDESIIIFRSAWALFQWLGIGSDCEKRSLLVSLKTSKEGPVMRLLGGLQCYEDEEGRAINVFLGGSCKRTNSTSDRCEDYRTVLQTYPANVDAGNSCHGEDLKLSKAKSGMETVGINSMEEFDTFSLTWSADSTRSQKYARLIASVGEGVRVGSLQLHIPSTGVLTNLMISKVNGMLATLDHTSLN